MEHISPVFLQLHISNWPTLRKTETLVLGAAPPGGGAVSDWCNITTQLPLRYRVVVEGGREGLYFSLSFSASTPGTLSLVLPGFLGDV